MERKKMITADGSHTILLPQLNITYHSIFGALQESRHVFIKQGIDHFIKLYPSNPVRIFEMGFGTALNTLLTCLYAREKNIQVCYEALELFPMTAEETRMLNYTQLLPGSEKVFYQFHHSEWNTEIPIDEYFVLKKIKTDLLRHAFDQSFHLIYYDAFAPDIQPYLWTENVFRKLHGVLSENGILVTYCSKGDVRRALLRAGFAVEKIPGPPGKREIIRAVKMPAGYSS